MRVAVDWSAVGGVAGGLCVIASALFTARQKYRVDELKTAMDVLQLKQQHIDELQLKLDGEIETRKRLEAQLAILTSVFSWDHVPPSLQAILDRLEEAVKTMVVILKALDTNLLNVEKRNHDT